MKLGRVLILVALILILGVATAFLWLKRSAAPAAPGGGEMATPEAAQNMLPVVVAAQPIRRGTKITDAMLTTVKLPADRVLAVQLTDPKQAIGKLAVRDLAQGMFITRGDVAEKLSVSAEGSLASLQIPPGSVAISIPMTRLSGVAYGIRPGDHVAVLASFPFVDVDQDYQSVLPNKIAVVMPPQTNEQGQSTMTAGVQPSEAPMGRSLNDDNLGVPFYVIPSEAQRARLVSQMLIQDAAVLYVGTFPLTPQKPVQPTGEGQQENNQQQAAQPTPPPQAQQGQQTGTENTQQQNTPPDIITLVVSPQEAVTLKYLMDRQVPLTLALRAGGDTTELSSEAVTLTYVLDTYKVVVPAKLPYDIQPRMDQVVPPTLQNDMQLVQPQQ
ncbi:MAG TPA: hypothetical protein ENJ54_08885 [Chloroflexi bacterium]|nr:hypothetical protein [Chloroflexota bacterium]